MLAENCDLAFALRVNMEPLEAKRFFIDKVTSQAQREGRPLDDLETKILYFTETGADACQEYYDASDKFDRERGMAEFEARISSLLTNAYKEEGELAKRLGRLNEVRDSYRHAYATLKQEDHYILVMIDQSIGPKLRRKFLGLF